MKIINRRSLSRKLTWCRDLIRRKLKTIFTRKQYKYEDISTKTQYKSEEEEEEEEEERVKEQEEERIKEEEEQAKVEEEELEELEEEERLKEEEEEEEEAKNRWSKELPDDVMQLILQLLPMSDYLSCRDVCPFWRVAIDSKRCLPGDELPWLLHSSFQSFCIKIDDYCFVSDRKICQSKNNRTYNCLWDCVGSIEGWLIMVVVRSIINAESFFFLNPVSGSQIMLPSHSALCRVKVVASSVPMTSTSLRLERSCYVACLHLQGQGLLAFCAPTDKSWTFIEADGDHEKALEFRDIEIVDGKLYAVSSHALEFLMVFDIQLDSHDRRLHTYTAVRLVTLHPNVKSIVEDTVFLRNCYLAKCSESKDLFMILHQRSYFLETKGFQVLKLEYNVTIGPQWVEIVNLGDRVLLMGGLNNKFISSSTTSHDKRTLERNSIYYVFDWGDQVYQSGVFSLIHRCIKPLTIPKDHSRKVLNETLWFTPNPW